MKVIAFDLFGTVFDLSETPREEIKEYLRQCVDPIWRPMQLPDRWKDLKAFPDAKEGVRRLLTKYRVVTCSNAPYRLTHELLQRNELFYVNPAYLESIQRYKPHPECYQLACNVGGVKPHEAMMVTANPTFGPYPFGDLEIAGAIGMKTQLIRNPGCPQTIIELAEQLGC